MEGQRLFIGSLVSLLPAFACVRDAVLAGCITVRSGDTPREGCLARRQRTEEDGHA